MHAIIYNFNTLNTMENRHPCLTGVETPSSFDCNPAQANDLAAEPVRQAEANQEAIRAVYLVFAAAAHL
jgi:hypothetical protein